MEAFFNKLTEINGVINDFVWVKIGLVLLIGTGILMTCCTKFFQLSHLKHWWKNTIGSLFTKDVIGHSKEKGSISPFQALCTALAATIGTGNIAGVAAAICIGGAGAVFWMWIAAFFGMMTNYSENVLGIYYRRKNIKGEWSGGAMYYLKDGLGSKKNCKIIGTVLAVLFSIFTLLASFGIGSMGQVNKIVANVVSAFEIKALSGVTVLGGISLYSVIIGVVIMALTALIVLGGLKRIANVAEKIVPFMVVLFVIGSLIIIGINYAGILPAFKAIFVTAFKPIAAVGGGIGVIVSKVVTQGFKRGVFSNEAGLGSSVMVHANSNVKEPVKQGMWGIFEVFADTMVVCTMTALVILTSGAYNLETGAILEGYTDATLVAGAFNQVFSWGDIGEKFIAIAMFLFAFTTVLGWSHYGTKAWEYLFGTKSTVVFKIIHICTIFFGAVMTSSLAWDISDTFNGLMMMPNLIGVIVMSPVVIKITSNYVKRVLKKEKIDPIISYNEEIQKEMAEAIMSEAE
ncbi:MAG: sodium:alanine symporter family protein [Clostridia bacterium]|nr:sodium:alanine symporter family protein [Clostridia bacterium]MEE1184717.1 sodium:alanine symporter family protein [Acutalibacteraceae bacterium]